MMKPTGVTPDIHWRSSWL